MHVASLLPLAGLTLLTAAEVSASRNCHRRNARHTTSSAHHSALSSISATRSPMTSAAASKTAVATKKAEEVKLAATSTGSSAKASSTSSHKLLHDYSGDKFFDSFYINNISDPTHGLVSYVDDTDAWSRGLVEVTSSNTVKLSIDSSSWLGSGVGRPSVRVEGNDRFDEGLFIIDLKHVPVGCSLWPAFWLLGDSWPNNGTRGTPLSSPTHSAQLTIHAGSQIDIFEGVNTADYNTMTLHTAEGCKLDTSLNYTADGSYSTTDCYAYGSSAGCGLQDHTPSSFGRGFNSAGGGVFATLWSQTEGIKIWHFPRGEVPSDIGAGSPEPSGWGTPQAAFGSGTCEIPQYFKQMWMVFDITTCGDWAGDGGVWADSTTSGTCSQSYSTCEAAVADPDNFGEGYFEINSLKVYSV
ncbi:hypothetical protein JCM8097_005763 [Rhodosporidiobolus ruineniae]